MKYKFRAQNRADAFELINIIPLEEPIEVDIRIFNPEFVHPHPDCREVDVTIDFYSLPIEAVRDYARRVDKRLLITQTLDFADKYTGVRNLDIKD